MCLSVAAQRAFPFAKELAVESGAQVSLLHIVEVTSVIPHGAPFAPPMPALSLESAIDQAKDACAAQANEFDDMPAHTVVQIGGDVGPAVARAVQQFECDLVLRPVSVTVLSVPAVVKWTDDGQQPSSLTAAATEGRGAGRGHRRVAGGQSDPLQAIRAEKRPLFQ